MIDYFNGVPFSENKYHDVGHTFQWNCISPKNFTNNKVLGKLDFCVIS